MAADLEVSGPELLMHAWCAKRKQSCRSEAATTLAVMAAFPGSVVHGSATASAKRRSRCAPRPAACIARNGKAYGKQADQPKPFGSSCSLAMCAVACPKISFFLLSSRFSFRNRAISARSSVVSRPCLVGHGHPVQSGSAPPTWPGCCWVVPAAGLDQCS